MDRLRTFTGSLVRLVGVAVLSTPLSLGADPPPQPPPYPNGVRMLIPVVPDLTAGASGTIWDGQVFIHNRSMFEVMALAGVGVRLSPQTTTKVDSLAGPRGLLIFVKPEDAPHLSLRAEVMEVSGLHAVLPQPVRIVPDNELATRRVVFLGVDVDGGTRTHLRIYDPGREGPRSFIVRVFRTSENAPDVLLSEVSVMTSVPALTDYWPGFASLSLAELVGIGDALRVEVEATDAAGFWGIVSITDNVTQSFRIIEPAIASVAE